MRASESPDAVSRDRSPCFQTLPNSSPSERGEDYGNYVVHQGPGLEALRPTWLTTHMARRQVVGAKYQANQGLGAISALTFRGWDSLPVREGRASDHCALHSPSSLLLKLLHRTTSDPLPLYTLLS
jgi:hypothetical protein